ncbi:MAG: hypothetical protein QMB54_04000, partial [Neofamilia sp.]
MNKSRIQQIIKEEVSNVLKAQNEARAKVAEINEKIEIIDKKLKDSEYESKASSLTAEKENLMSQRSTAIDERDSKDRAVEVLREQARLI